MTTRISTRALAIALVATTFAPAAAIAAPTRNNPA